MTEQESIVQDWLEGAKRTILADYKKKGLKASGAFGRSLETFSTPKLNGLRVGIKAARHAQYMIHGQKPHRDQTPEHVGFMYHIIKRWIEQKGLTKLKGAAWPIAYHIVHNGVRVPNRHNDGQLLDKALDQRGIDDMLFAVGRGLADAMKKDLIKLLKT